MEKDNPSHKMNRRRFMKLLGAGAAGAALASMFSGCGPRSDSSREKEAPLGQMTYRADPKNGNMLSLLAFGMMRLPRVARVRGEELPDVNDLDQKAVNDLVDLAIASGVNLFDTSPVYCKGFSEKATGEALSRYPRDKFFISTKLSNSRPEEAKKRDESLKIYRRSFESLRVDYIDYYLLHNVGSHKAFKERYLDNGMFNFLLKEKEAGRIKNLGWSFHGDIEFFEYMAGFHPWDFTLTQINYLEWGRTIGPANVDSRRLYEMLSKRNIPVWVMEPLLGGGLATPHYKARELMTSADPNASAASWAFRFAASLPNVTTVLSGMMFLDHMRDNIRTYSPFTPLTNEDRAMLEEVAQVALKYRNIVCTRCQYCMPCPYGINIPEIFAHYNRTMNVGNFPDDKQSPDYKRARRTYLVELDRSVSTLRQADRCTNCGLCKPLCTQRINIPKEMQRIDKFVEELKREAI